MVQNSAKLLEEIRATLEVCRDLEARCEDSEDEASDDVYNLVLALGAKIQGLIPLLVQDLTTEAGEHR